MKCEICQNDYPSHYYFTTPKICTNCFNNLSTEQKDYYYSLMNVSKPYQSEFGYRIGFGLRFLAYLIDTILFAIVFIAILVFTGDFEWIKENIIGFESLQNPALLKELTSRLTILTLILTPIYWSTEIFLSASPGKMVLNIMIANANRTQAQITTLLFRFLVKHITYLFSLLSFITSIVYFEAIGNIAGMIIVLGFLSTLGVKRQALHDYICKTAVFKKTDILDSELI